MQVTTVALENVANEESVANVEVQEATQAVRELALVEMSMVGGGVGISTFI